MKKWMGVVCSFLLLVGLLCLTVGAKETGRAQAAVSTSAVKQGETVTVTLSFPEKVSFKSLGLSLDYDKTLFTVQSGEWLLTGADIANFMEATGDGVIAYKDKVTKSGAFFRYTLQAKPTAVPKSTSVSATMSGSDETGRFAFSVKGAALSVICSNHKWGSWQTDKEPTCSQAGSRSRVCSRCGVKETESLPALGHKLGEWVTTKQPTCTGKGTQERRCTRDGCAYSESRSVSALGHDYGPAKTVVEATIGKPGIREKVCSRCGKKIEEEIPCSTVFKSSGVYMETVPGVFPEEATAVVSTFEKNSAEYAKVAEMLGASVGEIQIYHIRAIVGESSVQPAGTVTVSFPLDAHLADAGLYKLEQDGTVTLIEENVVKEDGRLTAKLERLGAYVLAVDADIPASTVSRPATEPSGTTAVQSAEALPEEAKKHGTVAWWWLPFVGIICLGAGVAIGATCSGRH